MHNKKYLSVLASGAVLAALAISAPALADTTPAPAGATQGAWAHDGMMPGGMRRAPGIFGTVASVSGNTITVTSKGFPARGTVAAAPATTYTVDATSAKVTKNNAESTVSAIAVGDTVMVAGTVTGTNVAATTIRDGVVPGLGMGKRPEGAEGKPPASIIVGNGQPVVGGSVTAISGPTLTVTNKSNVTYTVDATSAIVEKANAASTAANIAVGDSVVVQGPVNGSSITASSIMDQGAATSSSNASGTKPKGFMGVFAGIGGFFAHLFGF